MPSCTFLSVLSISCCSFLFAPIVHRQAGSGSKGDEHSENRESHNYRGLRKHRSNRFTRTPDTNSGNLPKPNSHQFAQKLLTVFRKLAQSQILNTRRLLPDVQDITQLPRPSRKLQRFLCSIDWKA